MKQMNLLAVIRRKRPYTVYADKVHNEIPNIRGLAKSQVGYGHDVSNSE